LITQGQLRQQLKAIQSELGDYCLELQAARRETGTPAVSFTTKDCERAYRELAGRGALFVSEPQELGYSGTDAVFEDGCGNLLNLHQD